MSKERELLESCLDEIQYHEVPCPELVTRIKELLAQPEQPEQTEQEDIRDVWQDGWEAGLRLAKREPLSDEEIKMKWNRLPTNTKDPIIRFARAIEKEHGIGGGE